MILSFSRNMIGKREERRDSISPCGCVPLNRRDMKWRQEVQEPTTREDSCPNFGLEICLVHSLSFSTTFSLWFSHCTEKELLSWTQILSTLELSFVSLCIYHDFTEESVWHPSFLLHQTFVYHWSPVDIVMIMTRCVNKVYDIRDNSISFSIKHESPREETWYFCQRFLWFFWCLVFLRKWQNDDCPSNICTLDQIQYVA
jgi:hypothetical protein